MFKIVLSFLLFSIISIPQALAETKSPALWKVSDEDTNIHILGSIHVLKPGTVWLTSEIQNLISTSDAIYLEMSAEQQSPEIIQPLMMQHGFLAEGDHIKNHISESLYTSLSAELTAIGMPEEAFARFRPWTAGVIYSTVKFIKLGFTPAAGVEATLVSLAQAQGIEIDGLETAEFQISLLSSMSTETQIAMLSQTLDDKDKLAKLMEDMTLFWTTGDIASLEKTFNSSFENYPYLRETLLTSRNQNWVGDIQNILDKPGNYLVTVGTAHLIGEQSLIELLGDADITVTRVQ